MRQVLGLLLLLVLNGCCCGKGCQYLEKESYAQVPLTLDDAKLLQNFQTTVTVTRKTESTSGGFGACGHSPLCVIFLPVMVYGALFPDKWRSPSRCSTLPSWRWAIVAVSPRR